MPVNENNKSSKNAVQLRLVFLTGLNDEEVGKIRGLESKFNGVEDISFELKKEVGTYTATYNGLSPISPEIAALLTLLASKVDELLPGTLIDAMLGKESVYIPSIPITREKYSFKNFNDFRASVPKY